MPLCNLPGANLYYVERGVGEPLLFLNGLAGDCLSWMGQLKKFGRNYRCLAVENRDVGQSEYVCEAYSIRDMAGDVLNLMDQLGLGSVHCVGVSMGGMIAQEIALAAPDRILSLALVNTLARCDAWFAATLRIFETVRRQTASTADFFQAMLPWWVSHRFFADAERIEWFAWLLHQNPYDQRLDGFLRQIEAVRRHDVRDRLANLGCPVLLLAGEDDHLAPPRYCDELHQYLPHAHRVVLPGVGHAMPIEDPGRFTTSIANFLSDQRKPYRISA